MQFRNDGQRSAVCRTLLSQVGLEGLWSERGPDLAAHRRAGGVEALPRESAVLVFTAWALWDGSGMAAVSDLFALDGRMLSAVAELLGAGASGPGAIDVWVERWTLPVSLSA